MRIRSKRKRLADLPTVGECVAEPAASTRPARFAVVAAVSFAILAAGPTRAPRCEDAPPGVIAFTARNALVSAEGRFRSWRVARASLDDEHPERSEVEVVIDLASVDTQSARRDEHLRSADFFDVARYPEATVRLASPRLERADAGERIAAEVTLDLHGVRKTFPMTFRIVDREKRWIAGQVTLRRTEFGVGAPESAWNPLSVDDEVRVAVEVIVPPATAAAGH